LDLESKIYFGFFQTKNIHNSSLAIQTMTKLNFTFFNNTQIFFILVLSFFLNPAAVFAQTVELIQTFEGHTDSVKSVAFSPDGKMALSGSSDNTIKLWDVETQQEIRNFKGHNDKVYAVRFFTDGNTIVSGSGDKTVRLWNITTGEKMTIFRGHKSAVRTIALSPDENTIVSGSEDNTIKLWDISTEQEVMTFQGHTKPIYGVAFSPDGRFILSGSFDDTLKLWDIETGEEIRTFEGHTGDVDSVAFSPDGKTALSGSSDNTIRLWNIKTGKTLSEFSDVDRVYAVTYSPDGQYALSGSQDNTMKLWGIETGTLLNTIQAHTDWVYSVTFSPDGLYALSGSKDKTLKLWRISSSLNASFTISPTTGTAPVTITLDASNSISQNEIVSYQWATSHGETMTGEQVELTFQDSGTYTITLTVTDSNAQTATLEKTIVINDPPQAAFTLSPNQGLAPLTVNLEASTSFDPDGTIKNYQWTSDDGHTTEGQQAEMTFQNSGDYLITLTVTDNDGSTATAQKTISVINEPPQAAFTLSPSQGLAPLTVNLEASTSFDPDGTIENYQWTSDDGQTTEGQQAEMTFQNIGDYTITLTVTDNNEATAIAQQTINVNNNNPPEAKFTVSPTEGQKPLTLRLDASQSHDPNGSIVNWEWKSSGGKTLEGEKTNFILTDVGEQTITLTVTDNEGATAIAEQTVTVFGKAPVAKFKASPLTGEAPLTVQLDSSDSYDSDGRITDYTWTISNGQQIVGRNPSILLEKSGDYEISLVLTDNDGLESETVIQTITVEDSGPIENAKPIAQLQVDPLSGVAPLTVTLDGSQSVDPDGGNLTTYDWVATDKKTTLTTTGETATLTFEQAGDYTLTLTVTDENGNTSSDSETITVAEFSEITFDGLENAYNIGDFVNFSVVEKLPKNALEKVDLWIAIQIPTGDLLFLTLMPQFSFTLEPTPFKLSIDNAETEHQILNDFEIPPGIGGDYTFYALYVKEGKNPLENLDNLETIQRSHLLIKSTTLANE
jgi:WD40 repeat protein/chitodextrinase